MCDIQYYFTQIQLNISVYNGSKATDGGQCPYSVELKDLGEPGWHKKEVCGYSSHQIQLHTSRKHSLEVFNAATVTLIDGAPVYLLRYQSMTLFQTPKDHAFPLTIV